MEKWLILLVVFYGCAFGVMNAVPVGESDGQKVWRGIILKVPVVSENTLITIPPQEMSEAGENSSWRYYRAERAEAFYGWKGGIAVHKKKQVFTWWADGNIMGQPQIMTYDQPRQFDDSMIQEILIRRVQ